MQKKKLAVVMLFDQIKNLGKKKATANSSTLNCIVFYGRNDPPMAMNLCGTWK